MNHKDYFEESPEYQTRMQINIKAVEYNDQNAISFIKRAFEHLGIDPESQKNILEYCIKAIGK